MNPKLMNMNKIGEFLDIFITSRNRREAMERAHVHAKAAGLWDTYSKAEKEEFTFFCYYLWMAAGLKRKAYLKKRNPMLLLPDGEDGRPDDAYHPGELKLGLQVEMEHTGDIRIARKISKDHLDEIKNYYSLLILMEKIHHDVTGQFFGDYFDAMGNKLQVAYLRAERLDEKDPLRTSVEAMSKIYKSFKNELMTADKKMRPLVRANPFPAGPFIKKVQKALTETPKTLIIQSVTMPIVSFTKQRAKAWLKKHGLKVGEFEKSRTTWRFRQHPPALFKNYFSKRYEWDGVIVTIGLLKRRSKGTYHTLERGDLKAKTAPKKFGKLTLK